MAATDAQRRANDAFLIASRNSAISAGIQGQPLNTTRAYKKGVELGLDQSFLLYKLLLNASLLEFKLSVS